MQRIGTSVRSFQNRKSQVDSINKYWPLKQVILAKSASFADSAWKIAILQDSSDKLCPHLHK